MKGEEIRAMRFRLRMSQQELGDYVGCSQPNVAMWEAGLRGHGPVTGKALDRLAKMTRKPRIQRRERKTVMGNRTG